MPTAPTLAAQFAAVDRSRPLVVGGPSYGEVADRADRMVTALIARGVRPGDLVAAQVGKRLDTLVLYLACVRSGIVFVPVNPAWTSDEVGRIDAEPALFLDDTGLDRLVAEASEMVPVEVAQPAPDALAVVLYTSGTTGRPKGAMLTQANIATNVATLVDVWGFTGDDVLLHALPVFHAHGLFVALGCVVASGASMVWLDRFEPTEVIAALPRCTVMMGVPTFYARLLADDRFTAELCTGMRLFVSGSAPLTAVAHRSFRERSGHSILERYGMTETVMLTSNPLHGERRPGSVGLPLPGVEVAIDPDTDEVVVRGPSVMRGYWGAAVSSEGEWFRTGDLGRFDDDGYLWLTGRAKDLIITGGLNVSPLEVEQVVDQLPGVAESAVIGVHDDDFGEAVVAVVVGDVDPDDVRAQARQHLAGYKAPKRVIVVDELPRNAMGKVEKAVLRARYGGRA